MLDLLTVNLWALPWPFAPEHAERQRRFADYLTKAAYHIVGIQELWWPWHRALRLDSIVFGRDRRDTGLALAAKLAIGGTTSVRHFGCHAGFDRLKRKGLLSARVLLERGVELAVHVTHLQAGTDRSALRARQVEEILGHVAGDDAPAILMGDFNFHEEDAEDRRSSERLRAVGFADAAGPGARPTYSSSNRYARRRACDQRFDRVFLRDGAGVRLASLGTDVVDGVAPPFSDHYPLHVRVGVEG